MKAYLVTFHCDLPPARLAGRRRKLAEALRRHAIELRTLRASKDHQRMTRQLAREARAAPVVTLDDSSPLPDRATWLADLTKDTLDLPPLRRPQVVYLTSRSSAKGVAEALRHPVLRHYIKRDEGGLWVGAVVEAVVELAEELKASQSPALVPSASPDIVGTSSCFRRAVQELSAVLQMPYGLVTGDGGVGKIFLIRTMWRHMAQKGPLVILPCGSFFRDYYVAGVRRRFGGGREAVDQLTPYLDEAQDGLLVLHHVEQLPTALQEELAVRLPSSSASPDMALRLTGVDSRGLVEHDVRLIATSTFSRDSLLQGGRLVSALGRKLCKRHVAIPSLVERGADDVRLLCEHIVTRIALRRQSAAVPRLAKAAMQRLAQAAWPDNISGLVRALEHAVHRCSGKTIHVRHLPEYVRGADVSAEGPLLDRVVAQAQRAAILSALETTGGDVASAARILGRNKHALYRLMAKLGLPRAPSRRRR